MLTRTLDNAGHVQHIVLVDHDAYAVRGASPELIELARHQLDILGVSAGHLPSRVPFTMSISPERPKPNVGDKRASRTISQPALLACFNDPEAFYELYNALTNKAIDLYARAGRRKFALKLHGSLAALDVCAHIHDLRGSDTDPSRIAIAVYVNPRSRRIPHYQRTMLPTDGVP